MTYEEIVAEYRRVHGPNAREELDRFAALPSLADAIREAGALQSATGCKRTHRWRMKSQDATVAVNALLGSRRRLQAATSFDDLLVTVTDILGRGNGAGELYAYDTALGIGAKLGLLPTEVYLHRGTRDGAKALAFDGERTSIRASEFDPPLRVLDPYELEDLLCIYKKELGAAKHEFRVRGGR